MTIDMKRVDGARYGGQISALIEVLSDIYTPREALQWIVSPQSLLQGRVPADLMDTPEHAKEVEALVDQLTSSAHT